MYFKKLLSSAFEKHLIIDLVQGFLYLSNKSIMYLKDVLEFILLNWQNRFDDHFEK